MRILVFLAMLALALPLAAQKSGGMGDLMVVPTRIILEGRDRTAEVALRNVGQEPCTYRIFFQEMRMLPSGEAEVVPKVEGTLAGSDLVRYSPRQVALAPGETQTVRIQVRKPEGLPDGEYRSHLVFQGVPPTEPPSPDDAEDAKTLSVSIHTQVAISIPVIVRHGTTTATVDLSGLILHPAASAEGAPTLDLRLGLTGNRSVQGEFKVDWLPRGGQPQTLLPVAGAAIYANLPFIQAQLPLSDAIGVKLQGGQLKAVFTPMDSKQSPVSATLDLP